MINDRFEILEMLGEGRSKVFKCKDQNYPGKIFALKILPKNIDKEEIEALKNEFFTLKKLYHPHIIQVFEFGTVIKFTETKDQNYNIPTGSKFYSLEYFESYELLETASFDNYSSLYEIIKQICSVLFYLHQSNYIYSDLKPQNILVSRTENLPKIKFVDFGFTKHIKIDVNKTVQGSPHFIAPEILDNNEFDHRADFYSLGILLYKLVYNKFPFEDFEDLGLFKSPLEEEIKFPDSDAPAELINIIKKLTKKNPEERYFSALEIILDLGFKIDEDISKNFSPAKFYNSRSSIHTLIDDYIRKEQRGKVILLKGDEGSGRSTLLEAIYASCADVIYIEKDFLNIDVEFWKYFLRKIFYSEFIHKSVGNNLLDSFINIIENETSDLLTILKSIFRNITIQNKFILLLDDFNRYDHFSIEIFKQLLPILQINDIKIIIAEDPLYPTVTDFINNTRIVNLPPFSKEEFDNYIDYSFADFFPKDEIKKIIHDFGDYHPGNILSLLGDLLILKLIDYKTGLPVFKRSEVSIKMLKQSQDEIYKLKISDLTENEIKVASILSLFETGISEEIVLDLITDLTESVYEIIESLREKSILLRANVNLVPRFVSLGLKEFVKSQIKNKVELHKSIAETIHQKHPNFNKAQLAKQFELGNDFESAFKIYLEDLESVEKSSSINYQKRILTHLIQLPLKEEVLNKIYYKYCITLFKLGEHSSCFEVSNKVIESYLSKNQIDEILIIRGKCLINIGKLQLGKDLLNLILPTIKNQDLKLEILLDIAAGELEEENFIKAESISNDVIEAKTNEIKYYGDAHNLLALIAIHSQHDLNAALSHFTKALNYYENANEVQKVAGMEINLGNIEILADNLDNAIKHWDRALKINSNVGNLGQEARLFLGYGVFSLRKFQYDEAISNYNRGLNIFKNIGEKLHSGICLANLGEVQYLNCEYDKASNSLNKAIKIFKKVNNFNEMGEVFLSSAIMNFYLNNKTEIESISFEYVEILKTNIPLDKHQTNLELIDILILILSNKLDNIEERIEKVKNVFSEANEIIQYTFCMKILSDIYLLKGFEDRCLAEIRDPIYMQISEENLFVKAQRNYLLGRISQINTNLGLKPAIEYFKYAFDIIEKGSITELTWEITFALSELYYERGNYNKSGEFTYISKKLLEEITSNIKKKEQKRTYLNSFLKKTSIEKLNYFAEQCSYA